MSKVVTVMNMKGGVGKTTVTAHLSGYLARYGFGGRQLKILAIDYDPQFNLSQAFLDSKKYFGLEKQRKTTISILLDNPDDLNPFQLKVPGNHQPPKFTEITTTVFQRKGQNARLDLIPSTLDLMYVALGQATSTTKPIEERFQKFIDSCREEYDLILIDCHPAGSLFTKTSLVNSDFVLIPVAPKKYAIRGIGLMVDFIESKKLGSAGPKPMVLFNLTPRAGTRPEESTIRSDKKYATFCLSSTLKKYKAFEDPEGGRGFVWASKKAYSTEAFLNLSTVAREISTRINL